MATSRKLLGVPILIAFLVGVCHAATKDYVYENAQYRVYRDTSLSVESYDTAAVPTASIVRHLHLINALLEIVDQPGCPCVVTHFQRQEFPVAVEMRLMKSFPDTNYICRGQWSISIGRHGFIKSFVMSGPCARDTSYKANYPMGCAIDSSGKAVEVARTFLGKLLRIHKVSDDVAGYDSVVVNEKERDYEIELIGKKKNYIVDTRKAKFQIDRRTGKINLYRGQLYSKYDLSYRPSISKEKALAALETEINKARNPPKHISITSLGVTFNRWAWAFFLCYAEDCEEGARTVIIDSETGEVIHSMID